jgi:hypothetical protein
MATFHNITAQEMKDFLGPMGFVELALAGTEEITYGKVVSSQPPVTMRIFTGIAKNGESRGKGEDAIRVALFTKDNTGRIYPAAGSKRVHRVKGWAKNLKERIDAMQPIVCTRCNNIMVVRKNKLNKSDFYGCLSYPKCKHTEEVND